MASHGSGGLTQQVLVVVLLDLAEDPTLVEILWGPREFLNLFLLEFLVVFNVHWDQMRRV